MTISVFYKIPQPFHNGFKVAEFSSETFPCKTMFTTPVRTVEKSRYKRFVTLYHKKVFVSRRKPKSNPFQKHEKPSPLASFVPRQFESADYFLLQNVPQ